MRLPSRFCGVAAIRPFRRDNVPFLSVDRCHTLGQRLGDFLARVVTYSTITPGLAFVLRKIRSLGPPGWETGTTVGEFQPSVLEREDDGYRTNESARFWKSNARIKNVPGSVEMVAYSSPCAAFSPIWRTISF
jgi:hypothetical protein